MAFSPFSSPSDELAAASKIASAIMTKSDSESQFQDRMPARETAAAIINQPVEQAPVQRDDASMNAYLNTARAEYKREVDERR